MVELSLSGAIHFVPRDRLFRSVAVRNLHGHGCQSNVKIDPASLHLGCGIRGQEIRLPLIRNATVSFEGIRTAEYGLSSSFRSSADLSMPHIRYRMAFHMQFHDSVG
jgi:hypothetical protein